jgi:ketosteroid isomerase-like protein
MPVAPRTFFQVGVLVDDIEAAADELHRAVGLRYEEAEDRRIGDWDIRTSFSLHGPPYIELIESGPGTPWFAEGGPRLDHLGFWSSDIEDDRRRLESEGLAVAIDGVANGGPWYYHQTSSAGMRIEHIDAVRQKGFADRRGGPDQLSPAAAIDAYFAGVNEERYDDVAALFAPTGVLMAPGTRPRTGDEIAPYFAAALAPYPEHFDDPRRVVLAGDTATVEIHFSGRHAGGGTMEFDAVDVFDFDQEGRIVKLTSWYDSHLVRRRLREISEPAPAPSAPDR